MAWMPGCHIYIFLHRSQFSMRMHYTTHTQSMAQSQKNGWTQQRKKLRARKHNLFIYVKHKNTSDNKTITVAKQHWQRTEQAREQARKNKRKIMERRKNVVRNTTSPQTHTRIIWVKIENWMRWSELDGEKNGIAADKQHHNCWRHLHSRFLEAQAHTHFMSPSPPRFTCEKFIQPQWQRWHFRSDENFSLSLLHFPSKVHRVE